MKFIRAAICLLVVFAVAAHGAVEDWSAAVLETGAALLYFAWAVRAVYRREEELQLPSLLGPLALYAGVVILQWKLHATVYGYGTRIGLQLLVAYVLLVFLLAQTYRTLEDWRGFVWFLMGLGFAVSIFGILQHLTFNGKLYWFREMRYGGIPFGPYVNRNHFAGLMELLIPAGLVPLALGKVRRERRVVVGLFTVVSIVALFLSASRGGIISFAIQVLLVGVIVALRRSSGKHLMAGGVVVLLALGLVSWLGVREALERFASMQPLEVTSSKRASMAGDTWRIFLDHPLTGTGLGTLQYVYPAYETQYDGKLVDHAHNDYLETLAETGFVGGACMVWFLVVLFGQGLRKVLQPENSYAGALQSAGLVSCAGLLVHSLVDFNLHIPSNALLFLFTACLATSEIRLPLARNTSGTPRNE